MSNRQTAADLLGLGNELRARVKKSRSTVAATAADAGIPRHTAHKAHWLAGTYDASARRKLGRKVLEQLSPMHLEVVACCHGADRERLLRAAAADALTARELRELVRAESKAGDNHARGTIDALKDSARAMEHYAQFDDRALRTLLNGPNGAEVRQVALAGQMLASRLPAVPARHQSTRKDMHATHAHR